MFELIRGGSASTRAEIGRLTGLSRTAVAARLAVLVDAGLVRETEEVAVGVGRPPTRIAFHAASGVVCAAAIGRSRSQLAVCDLAGSVLAEAEFDQEIGAGPDDLMPRVIAALRRLLARSGHKPADVRGIGMSVPGTVDTERRCSYESPFMAGWHGKPLDAYFASLADAPVFLDTDTNVIALAEREGHLDARADALIVKASTGFGAAIVSDGALHHGARGAAGEIGHVKYAPAAGRACRCGEQGCLEAVAGGWALVQAMRKRRPEIAHVRDVVTLALSGDLSARRHLRDSGRHLGTVLAAVVTLLNPAVLVIGGDIAPAYDIFVAGLREALYRDASALATRDLDIVAATHGAQAGVRGCAVLALDHVLTAAVIDRQHALA